MIIKMQTVATPDEIAAVEAKVHGLGYTTGKMIGEQVTLIGVYGDISRLPSDELAAVRRGELLGGGLDLLFGTDVGTQAGDDALFHGRAVRDDAKQPGLFQAREDRRGDALHLAVTELHCDVTRRRGRGRQARSVH